MARLQQTQRKRVGSVPRLPDDVVAAIAAEIYEKVAAAFHMEEDVVIGNLDAEKYKDIGEKYVCYMGLFTGSAPFSISHHYHISTRGVVSPASSGISGGAFMVFRSANGKAQAFDMRESAPMLASQGKQY
ncbi:hypothetical protein AgCh_031142 [Apium graveolens]